MSGPHYLARDYGIGVALALICAGTLVAGARHLRTRLVPGWAGAPAWVADGVIVASLTVAALEVAGILGVLDRIGAPVACVTAGALAWLCANRIRARGPQAAPPSRRLDHVGSQGSRGSRVAGALAIAAFALVAGPWLGWTIFAYRHGMQTIDTLWYHLPSAARFVQLGNIRHLQYFDRDPVTVFYPANSELFHALGLLLFRSDALSPAIDLGWAALALVAAWAIGRPWQRGPHCLIAVLLVLGTPGLVDTQPGGAYNDVMCLALLLAGVALLINGQAVAPAGSERHVPVAASALAAAAAGLALGTKFTMIVPAILLGAGTVAVVRPGSRRPHAMVWVAGLVGLGGYWYLRNWLAVGNPLPSLAIHLGPISFPAPYVSTPTYTVGQYLTNFHIWKLLFVPGLRESLGLAWWALILGAAAGWVGTLLRGGAPVLRMIGFVGAAAGLAFLVTPQFLGLPNLPIFFRANVRYVAAALALGLVLLPILPALRTSRRGGVWLAGASAALVLTEVDPGVWPTGLGLEPFATSLRGAPAIFGALSGLLILAVGELALWRGGRRPAWVGRATARGPLVAAGAATAVVAVAAGWLVADSYATRRYSATPPLPSIYAWAQDIRHARIGVVGFDLQYPLYGPDASNYVQYIGDSAPHGGFGSDTSCREWRQSLNRGHYGWVLVTPFGFPIGTSATTSREVGWTAGASQARAVIRERTQTGELAVLYRLSGPLDPQACPRTG
jgi:hypothetical protein